ncbi:MAG: hypothetical protein LZF62_360003 [Nitrospira sp.]|nr:MAG: hypothetical protein LZF62_360003 [Nitrospira sp.]
MRSDRPACFDVDHHGSHGTQPERLGCKEPYRGVRARPLMLLSDASGLEHNQVAVKELIQREERSRV